MSAAVDQRSAHQVEIDHLKGRVKGLEDANRTLGAQITDLLVAMGRLETRQAVWGVIATIAAPLIATAAAWLVVRSAGAQVVAAAPVQVAAPPAAATAPALAGIGVHP